MGLAEGGGSACQRLALRLAESRAFLLAFANRKLERPDGRSHRAPAGAQKAAVAAKAAMTAVTTATVIAAKAPSASPRTASAPRPLVRRASQEAKNYSCCQNCHVPMSLCHCQKSACSICGLSALNCSCKARPSSARPASAPVCKKCAKLDESLSKAQAQHKVLERELAAKRVGHVGHAGHVAWPLPLLTDLFVCVSRRQRRAHRCRQR